MGEKLLVGVHPLFPPLVDHALRVAQGQILPFDAEGDVELRAGNPRRTGAAENDLDIGDFLSDDFQRVQKTGAGDDRRPVLVIVEHGDVHRLLQLFLNNEALRGFDVLQVDPAKRRLECLDDTDDLRGIFAVELDVENIDIGKSLEEDAFPFHHGFSCQRTDVAETKDGGAVADDGDEVSLRRVLVSIRRIRCDLETRDSDTGCVCERKISLRRTWFRRNHFDLSPTPLAVVVKGILLADHGHVRNSFRGTLDGAQYAP